MVGNDYCHNVMNNGCLTLTANVLWRFYDWWNIS